MHKRLIVLMAIAIAIAAAVPATAQAPGISEAIAGYLANLPADFNGVAVSAVKARLDAGEKMFVLDVREPSDFANGHIQGAVNVPIRTLLQNLDKLPAKDALIVAVCGVGTRGSQAAMALSMIGYTNVKNMNLGLTEWTRQNFPLVK